MVCRAYSLSTRNLGICSEKLKCIRRKRNRTKKAKESLVEALNGYGSRDGGAKRFLNPAVGMT